MSLGDSPRSEVRNRDAEEEERQRAEQAAKEQKAERRREKAATRALQEKENVAWREEIASQMQNFANKLQHIQYHQQSGSSNVATAKQVADLQACMENWKMSDAKRHQEQSKLLQERHQDQTRLLQERHYEYMSGLHEIIRTQVSPLIQLGVFHYAEYISCVCYTMSHCVQNDLSTFQFAQLKYCF